MCAAHTTCEGAQWETKASATHHDRECKAHTICAAGWLQTTAAGTHHDRECKACGAGYKCDGSAVATLCSAGNFYQDEAMQSTCKSCAACPGKFIRTGCGESSAGTCTMCSSGDIKVDRFTCQTCSAGKFEADRTTCESCTAGRFSGAGAAVCTSCSAGTYQPAIEQGNCNTCTGNNWAHEAGSALHSHGLAGHVKCTPHTVCHAPEWQTKEPSNVSDRECTSHTLCNMDSHYQTKAAGTHHDRECTVLTQCLYSSEYRSVDKTDTSDRACTPLTVCDFDTQYESKPKTATADRVCSALTDCGIGHFAAAAPTFTSDRVCQLCPAHAIKPLAGNAASCTPCEEGQKAIADRTKCYTVFCSHLRCMHEEHTCLFGANKQFRAFPQSRDWPNDRGNCDGRTWGSIRVYHDNTETNCRDGHRCGMGIATNDRTKCECVPTASQKVTAEANAVVTLSNKVSATTGPYQVLELSAVTKKCVDKGDLTKVNIAYRAADGKRGSALAFKFEYDSAFYKLVSKKRSDNADCELSGFSEGEDGGLSFVSYVCASYSGKSIVPAADSTLMQVELEATGASDGLTSLAVKPNAALASKDHSYKASNPLQVRVGQCGSMLDTVGPIAIAAAASAAP